MPENTFRTQYYTAATLDGFIADANHSLEWLFQFGEAGTSDYPTFIAEVGAIAMGSSTYEWVLNHLEQANPGNPQAWPYSQPTWVFSTRNLPLIAGADIRFVRGDVAPVHAAMREVANGRNVWLVGGGELVGQFVDQGLLDEFIVTLAPVMLGAGKPLLPRRIVTPPMRLQSTDVYGPFVQLRYAIQRKA